MVWSHYLDAEVAAVLAHAEGCTNAAGCPDPSGPAGCDGCEALNCVHVGAENVLNDYCARERAADEDGGKLMPWRDRSPIPGTPKSR